MQHFHPPRPHRRRLAASRLVTRAREHASYYEALQESLPGLMTDRAQAWGKPGSEIDPQSKSPFYNGRIPQEITDVILEYALTPNTVAGPVPRELSPAHDFCVRQDHARASDEPEAQPLVEQRETAVELPEAREPEDGQSRDASGAERTSTTLPRHQGQPWGFDWYRPDVSAGRNTFPGKGLLETCRRVYLDANHFLANQHEEVIWQGRDYPGAPSYRGLSQVLRQHKGPPLQIKSLSLYAQMHHLENIARGWIQEHIVSPMADNSPEYTDYYWHLRSLLSKGEAPAEPVWRMLSTIQKFHITIRRTDWFRWEDTRPLAMDISRVGFSTPDPPLMREDMRAATEGRSPALMPLANGSFGSMFRIMTGLRELTITLETSEDKREEMEEIIEWARTWRFEVMSWRHWMIRGSNEVVSHLIFDEDKPVQRWSWRGLPYHWSDSCPSCSASVSEPRNECPYCQKRERLQKQGKGPRLLVWKLTWRPQPVDPPVSLEDSESRVI